MYLTVDCDGILRGGVSVGYNEASAKDAVGGRDCDSSDGHPEGS